MGRPRVKVTLTKEELGRRLQAARRRHGLAQAKLATVLETSQSHVSDMERGVRKPTIQQLVRLARALRTSVDELLTGELPSGNGFDYDARFLRRLEKIDQLPERDKQVLLRTIDNFLKAAQTA